MENNLLLVQSKRIAKETDEDTIDVMDMITERVNKKYPHLGFIACPHDEFRDICIQVKRDLE